MPRPAPRALGKHASRAWTQAGEPGLSIKTEVSEPRSAERTLGRCLQD